GKFAGTADAPLASDRGIGPPQGGRESPPLIARSSVVCRRRRWSEPAPMCAQLAVIGVEESANAEIKTLLARASAWSGNRAPKRLRPLFTTKEKDHCGESQCRPRGWQYFDSEGVAMLTLRSHTACHFAITIAAALWLGGDANAQAAKPATTIAPAAPSA